MARGTWSWLSGNGDTSPQRKQRQAARRRKDRKIFFEALEERRVLAIDFAAAGLNVASGSSIPNATADFNGDGFADLAAPNGFTNSVTVSLLSADGSVQSTFDQPVGTAPTYVVAGDFNTDGKADLAVANLASNNVSILRGLGDGSFAAPTNYQVGISPIALATGDFDGDGGLDLAIANFSSGTVSVLRGQGDGSFALGKTLTVGSRPISLLTGDWNSDGKRDLAVGVIGSASSYVLYNTSSSLQATSDGTNLTISNSSSVGQVKNLSVDFTGGTVKIAAGEAFSSAPAGWTLAKDGTLQAPASALAGSINVTGGAGDDTLTVTLTDGQTIPTINYEGGAGGFDTLVINGGSATSVTHSFINAHDGGIELAGVGNIQYTGLEPIVDLVVTPVRVFNYTGAAETIVVSDGTANDGMTMIASSLGESVYFLNPDSMTIDVVTGAASGADIINVNSVDAGFRASLSLIADGGDTINVGATLTLGSATSTGDFSVSDANLVTLSGGISTDQGPNAGSISILAPVRLVGNVTLDTDGGGTDGNVTFDDAFNADGATNERQLTIAAGDGTVSFADVGLSTRLNTVNVSASTINISRVRSGAGGVNLAATTALNLNGIDVTNVNAGPISVSGPVNLNTGVTLSTSGAGNITLGTGSTVNGGQTLALTTSTGSIALNNAVLGGTTAIASLALTGANVNGSGNITTTGGVTVTNTGTASTLSGVIGGTGATLTKAGAGAVLLTGSNSFTGGINLSAGTLQVSDANPNALGPAANTITFTGNSTLHNLNNTVNVAQGITVNSGVTAILRGAFDEVFNVAGAVTGSGTIRLQGDSNNWVVNFNSTANTFTGPIQIQNSSGTSTLTMNSLADAAANIELGTAATNNSGSFVYGTGAIVPLVLNQRQISLAGTTSGGSFLNNASAANTVTINTDVLIGGVGAKILTLGGSNTGANTFAGKVVDGTGSVIGLTKANAGTWVLTNANTYTGATSVAAGVLNIQNATALGTSAAGTTVSSGATLQLQNNITVTGETLSVTGDGVGTIGAVRNISGANTWTGNVTVGTAATTRIATDAGTLTINGNVALSTTSTDQFVLQGDGAGAIGGIISGVSRLTRGATGTGTWSLSGANTYAGKTTISNGALSVASLNSVTGGATSGNLGAPSSIANGTIDLGGTAAAGRLIYTGAGETTDRVINLAGTTFGGTLDQSGTGLLKFSSNATATGAGAKTLTFQGSTAGTGEFAGAIVNSTANTTVTKAGTGTWTLTGTNTYTGATNFNGGNLSVADVTDSGVAGPLGAGTSFTFGGGALQYSAATADSSNRAVTLNAGGGGVNVSDSAATLSLSGTVTGNNGFTKFGAGAMTWTPATAAISNVFVSGGNLTLNSGVYTVSSTLLPGAAIADGALATGNGTLNIQGTSTVNVGSISVNNQASTVGTINQSGTAAVNVSGVIRLGHWPSGTGTYNLSAGTLTLTGNPGAQVNQAAAAEQAGVIYLGVDGTGVFNISGGSVNATAIVLDGRGNTAGTDTLAVTGGTITLGNNTNATTIAQSGIFSGSGNANTSYSIQLGGGGTLKSVTAFTTPLAMILTGAGASAINIDTNGVNLTFGGVLSGTGGLTKIGAGTLSLGAANTSTGAIAVSAGTLSGTGSLSDSTDVSVASGAIYNLAASDTIDGLSGSGSVTLNGNTLTVGGANDATPSYSGAISGTGGVTKIGTGQQALTGSSSYTGVTTISAGTLSVGSLANGGVASSIGQSANAATNLVLNGGVLQYTGAAVSTDRLFSVGTAGGTLDLSGTGAVNFTNTGALGFNGATGARTLTLTGSNTGLNTIAAVIGDNSGATAVTKTGTGTISLTGTNTYTGATTISNGTLLVNGSISGSAVTVQSGATLGGTGSTGALTIISGAFHKPGNSPGLTTVNGNYTENGTLEIEFGGNGGVAGTDYDQVKVIGGGSVSLGGTSLLSVPAYLGTAGTFNPTFAQVFTIIDNDGVGPGDLTGTFSNAAAGTAFTVDGKTLKVYYGGNDGNDVVLVSQNGTPTVLYVNDEFTVANAAVDGDGETAGMQAAYVGLDAFATVADALTAYPSFAGVIYVNGGYSNTALLAGGGAVTLRMIRDLNNAENDVTLTNVSGDASDAIVTQFLSTTGLLTIQQGSFAGVISGTGGVTKSTTNSLTLSGANSYSGLTDLSAGTIVALSAAALGTTAAGTTITAGATLDVQANIGSESITVAGAGVSANGALVTSTGTGTVGGSVTMTAGTSIGGGGTLSIDGIISGAFAVTKTGTGTLAFTNANSYSGGTTLSQGTFVHANNLATGATTAGIVINDANTGANATTLRFTTGVINSSTSTVYKPITVNNFGSTTTLLFNQGGAFVNANVAISKAITIDTTAGGSQFGLMGTISGAGAGAGNTSVTYANTGGATFYYTAGYTGSGVAANSFSGNVVVNGNINLQNLTYINAAYVNGVIPDAAGVSINSGATWTQQWGAETIDALNGSGNLNNNGFAMTVGSAGGTGAYSGVISGAASLTKTGGGTQTLTGGNSYSGGTVVSGTGTLQIGNGTVNGTIGGGTYAIGGTATLRLNYATAAAPTWANISGAGTLSLNSAQAVNGTANWGTLGLVAGFTGKLVLEKGRFDTNPTGFGGTTTVDVRSGGQVLFFDNTANTYNYPQNFIVAGTGWGEGGQPGALRSSIQSAVLSGTVTMAADSTIYTQSATTGKLTLNGVISGAFNLTAQASGGVITFGAANTYTGTTNISAGTLVIGGSGSLGSGNYAAAISNSGTLQYSSSAAQTLSGAITGTGALTKNSSAGTLTLTNSGVNYSGNTAVDVGTLVLSGTTGFASAITTITSPGILELNSSNAAVDNWRINTVLAGSGTINKTGTGWIQTSTNAHTFSGTVNVQAGTFGTSFLNSNWSGITADFNVSAGALLDARGQAITVGSLNGAGNVGTTWNTLATVNVGAANKSGNISGSIQGNASTGTNNTANPNGGVLNLVKIGTGSQIFSGANTYSGTTTISAGTLQIGNNGTSGTLGTGAVTNNATLAFNRTDTVTVANNITGTGVINQLGAGTTTLTGVNTAGGGTNVTSGRLNINNTLGSNVIVTSPGILGGTGAITGNVSGNGTVAPGNSPGILTINGAFTPTGTIQYEVNSPWTTPGTDFDLINVNGTADLSGATLQFVNTLDASAPTALSVRTILANDGADATTPSANPAQGATVTIGTRTFKIYYNGGDGNDVVLVEAAQPTIVYVDDAWNNYTSGTIIPDADPIAGGAQQGVYGVNAFSGVNANYLFADAFNAVAVAGTVVVNEGNYSAQTVNINKQLTLNAQEAAISFGSLDDSVTNATLNLNGITLTVGALNTNTQFDSVIASTGSLVKTGTGTLTLSASNTYGGSTTVSDGVLQVGPVATLPAIPLTPYVRYSFDAGTVSGATVTNLGAGVTKDGTLTNGATVNATAGLGGSGALSIADNDDQLRVALGGVDGATKGVDLSGGVWTASAWFNGLKPTGLYRTLFRGNTNDHQVIVQDTGYTLGTYNNGGNVFVTAGYNVTPLTTGWHQVTAVGSGTTTQFYIDGVSVGIAATYRSATDIFSVGNATGAGGQPFADLIDNVVLYKAALTPAEVAQLYQATSVGSVTNVIPDTSNVTVAGTGTLNLNGANETIGSLAGAGAVQLGTGALTAGGTNASTTFSGVISSGATSGGLAKTGTGTLTLAGASTYAGNSTVAAGTLQLSGGANRLPTASSVTVNSGAFLDLNNQNQQVAQLLGVGRVVDSTNDATLPTLTIANSVETRFDGILGNTSQDGFNLIKQGAARLTLGGANTYSGATTISNGTLRLGNNLALGAVTTGTTVNSTGTLDFGGFRVGVDGNEPLFVEGSGLAGVGALLNSAAAPILGVTRVLTMTNNATFNSASRFDIRDDGGDPVTFDMNGFTLTKIGAGDLAVVSATVADPGSVNVNQTVFRLEAGTDFDGTGTISVVSGATFDIYGNTQTFNVNVTLAGGANLSSSGGAFAGTGATLAGLVTLNGVANVINGNNTLTINGQITGAGGMNKSGANVLTINNGANNFTGANQFSAGTVIVTQNNALGTAAGSTTVLESASLVLSNVAYATAEPLVLVGSGVVSGTGLNSAQGALRSVGGNNSFAGNISVGNDATNTSGNPGALIVSGTAGNTFILSGAITSHYPLAFGGDGNTSVTGAISGVGGDNYRAGLLAGFSNSSFDQTAANSAMAVQLGVNAGQSNVGGGNPWADNRTWVYTGQFFDADGIFAFAENIDDNVLIKIDGVTRLLNTNYDIATTTSSTNGYRTQGGTVGTVVVGSNASGGTTNFGMGPNSDGWHTIEVRMGNGAGGAGASSQATGAGVGGAWSTTYGFGFSASAPADANGASYIKPIDAGTASLFRTRGFNSLTKLGTGTLTLSGANTYSGETTVEAGTLVVNNNDALGTPASGNNSPTTILAGATISLPGGLTTSASENLVIDGAGSGGLGVIQSTGVNTFGGNLTAAQKSSGSITLGSSSGTLTIGGGINLNYSALNVLGAGNVTVNGAITGVGANTNRSYTQEVLVDNPLGFWQFNETGDVAFDSSGRNNAAQVFEEVRVAGRTGAGTAISFDGSGDQTQVLKAELGSLLSLTGNNQATISLWVNGDVATQPRAQSTFGGYAATNSTATRVVHSHLPWSDSVVYWDAGNGAPATGRTQTAAQPAANFEGAWNNWVFVKDGVTNNASIYLNGALVVQEVGTETTDFTNLLSLFIGGGDSGSYFGLIDDFAIYNSALSAARITQLFNANSTSQSQLTATNNVVKVGTGTLTLAGANTYTGTTTVNDGTLLVNGSLADGPAAIDVVVNDTVSLPATTLSGVGTINGAVQLNSGTVVAPGATAATGVIGTLIVNNNFTFTPGSTYQVDITPPGSTDKLQVSGAITLGNATLSVTSSGNLSNASQQTFNIIDNTGTTPVSGIFNGLAEGSTVNVNGSTVPAFITYNGGTGNSIGVDVNLNTQPIIDGTNGNDILVIRQVAGDPTQYQFSLNAAAFVNVPAGLPFTFNAGDGTDILVVDLVNGPVAPVGGLFFNGNNGADIFSVKGTNAQTATYTPSAATVGQSTVVVGAGSYSIFTTEEVDLFGLTTVNFALGAVTNSVAIANTTGTNASANIPPNAHPTVSTAAALGLTGTTNGIAFSDLKLWSIGTFNLNSSTGADTLTLNSGNNAHAVANVNLNTLTGADSFTALGELAVTGNLSIATQNIAFNGGLITTPLAQQVSLNAGTGAITTNSAARDVATGDLIATAAGAITLNVETATIQASSTVSGDITLTEETSVNLVSVTTAGGNISATANNSLTATSVVAGGSGFNATLTATTGNAIVGDVTATDDVVTINAPLGTITDLDNTTANDITANTINLTSGLGVGVAGVNGSLEVSAATAQTVNASATTSGGIFLNNVAGAVNFNNIVTSGVGAIELRSVANTTLTNVVAANGRIDAFTAQTSGAATNVLSVVSSTDNDANDITIIATTGELNITTVNAGTTSGDVVLQAIAGGINDDGVNATRITADDLTLTAAGDVGNSGALAELDTAVITLAATSNSSITTATDLDADGVWINETNGLVIRAAGVIAGANGLVSIDVDAGSLTTNDVVTAGGSGTVLLNADAGAVTLNAVVSSTSGAITVNGDSVAQNANIATGSSAAIAVTADVGGIVMASGTNATTGSGVVSYSAANGVALGVLSTSGSVLVIADSDTNATGGITDANGAANNVVATNAILTAATGIGSAAALETVVSNLAASNSNSGAINVDNLQTTGLTIAGLTVLATTVNGVTNGGSGAVNITNTGAITVNTPVAAGGPIFLHAIEAAGPGQNMTVAANVTSTANTVTLTAGDDFTLQATQAISGTSVTINTDADNAGSTVSLAGSVTATAGNITLNTAGGVDNVTLTGSLTANGSGNITVNLGGGNDVFDARTPTTGTLSAAGGVITVNAGNGADIIRLGDNTRTASITAQNTVLQGLDSSAAENPDGADQFFIRALSTTPFEVEGDDPTLPAGDVLNLDMTGALGPATVSHGIPNTTVTFFGGPLAVTYREIETYINSGGVTNDIFDLNNFTTGGNVFDVQLLDVNTLQVQLDGVPVWTSPDDQVNSLTFAGRAASADAVRVHGMAGTGQLPTEAGGLLGQTVFAAVTYPLPTISGVRKTVSTTFNTNSRSLPNNTNAPAFYYDGRGDSSNSGGDAIVLDLPTARNVAYLPDSSQPAAGDLSVQSTGTPFIGFAATFRNVANINLREQVAAGSSLLVDASSSDATANFILTDIADPAPANPNSATDPVNLPGATQIAADTNLARTRFGNFQTVTVRSGNGADLMDMLSIDPLGLTAITLDSDNTASTDASADTIRVRSVAATVTGGVTLLGGAGNDILQIFDAVPTSKNVATQVVVSGEGGTDSLQINDSGSAIADTTLVYEDRVQGITNFSGADDVTWTGLETLTVNTSAAADTITVDMDNVDNELTVATIDGSADNDLFLLNGVRNLTTLNLLGNTGADTFGQNAPLPAAKIVPSTPAPPMTATVIVISGETSTATPGATSVLVNPSNPAAGPDRLNIDISSVSSLGEVVDTGTGQVLSLGATATHAPLYFNGIEDIDLYNDGILTDAAIGDLYVVGAAGDVNETFIYSKGFTNANDVNLRYQNLRTYGPFRPTTRIFNRGYGGNDQMEYNFTINPLGPAVFAEFRGDTGNDTLAAGASNDLLVGGSGNDTLRGGAGNDVLWGDVESTIANGLSRQGNAVGDGNDSLLGQDGDDIIFGGGGADNLQGALGNDYLHGGLGNDTITGGSGVDILRGEDGADTLSGDGESDIVLGGAGNDRIWGRAARDIMVGGDGVDILTDDDGSAEDLTVADITVYDLDTVVSGTAEGANDAIWRAILSAWVNTDPIATRRTGIIAGTYPGLASNPFGVTQTSDDGDTDTVIGQASLPDWILLSPTDGRMNVDAADYIN